MPHTLCPFAARCGLAQSIGVEAALHVWESFYCESFFDRCERFRLNQSGLVVPRRLLPNGRLLGGSDAAALAIMTRDFEEIARVALAGDPEPRKVL
jgi:hypothetical protein